MTTRHAVTETELGRLTVVAADGDLTGVYFPHHWYAPPRAAFGPEVAAAGDALLAAAARQLAQYLQGERTAFDLPTRTSGSPFEERVWALLREIPYGATTTYGTLARQLGDRALAKDVGRAAGHNPLPVIVPCHRVLGADGKLTGYAGGLARKRALLEREGAIAPVPLAAPALF